MDATERDYGHLDESITVMANRVWDRLHGYYIELLERRDTAHRYIEDVLDALADGSVEWNDGITLTLNARQNDIELLEMDLRPVLEREFEAQDAEWESERRAEHYEYERMVS